MSGSGKVPLGREVRLITSHSSGLWALAKPSGVRSHPNDDRPDPKALLTVAYDQKAQCYCDGERRWFLLHRLDAPTSGVVLLADNRELADEIKRMFADREVEKTYIALVRGKPSRREDLWRDHLQTEKRGRALRTRTGTGDLALAEMKCLHSTLRPPVCSLLELQPKTGRTHQLRIQCASRQLPIIGDGTYGDFSFNRDFVQNGGSRRLFLHAHRVRLRLSWRGQSISLKAEDPLPAEFSIGS